MILDIIPFLLFSVREDCSFRLQFRRITGQNVFTYICFGRQRALVVSRIFLAQSRRQSYQVSCDGIWQTESTFPPIPRRDRFDSDLLSRPRCFTLYHYLTLSLLLRPSHSSFSASLTEASEVQHAFDWLNFVLLFETNLAILTVSPKEFFPSMS